ncbi:MAG: N-acetylmuramoyl-L-alanine amidase [Oscillospiraceae bacterium]|nr:N-acetylmuramoyl-L-alanine amidase [Oscillospiraceae bacterium]
MKFACFRFAKKIFAPILITALVVSLLVALYKVYEPANLAASARQTAIRPTVVLDAGHGGFDGGAVSVYGTLEKDINLSVAKKTEEFLKLFGFEVVMTRQSDEALSSSKKEDMYKRLDIIKGAPDSVFVSIHQNNFSQSRYFGAQMFYGSKNLDDSRALALALQENFKTNLNPQNTREVKPAPSDLFLFKNAPQPSVLVECGFLSNYNEAKLLANEEYQNQIAFTIAQSIIQFYANDMIERTYQNGSAEV